MRVLDERMCFISKSSFVRNFQGLEGAQSYDVKSAYMQTKPSGMSEELMEMIHSPEAEVPPARWAEAC